MISTTGIWQMLPMQMFVHSDPGGCVCANRITYSSSSSILALRQLVLSLQRLPRRGPSLKKTQKRRRRIARCGTTAMMSA